MLLYRFLNAEYGLRALQMRKWKVGRLKELNDPFDCEPLVPTSGALASEVHAAHLAEFSDSVGILCFCEEIANPVVWSHYADHHKGVAIGLDIPNGSPNFYKVQYQNERPKLNIRTKLTDAKDLHDQSRTLLSQGFSVKAPSWSYESEHRQFIPLFQCKMDGPNYFYPISMRAVKVVILGARCPRSKEDVRNSLSVLSPRADVHKVDIKRARKSDTYFNLEID